MVRRVTNMFDTICRVCLVVCWASGMWSLTLLQEEHHCLGLMCTLRVRLLTLWYGRAKSLITYWRRVDFRHRCIRCIELTAIIVSTSRIRRGVFECLAVWRWRRKVVRKAMQQHRLVSSYESLSGYVGQCDHIRLNAYGTVVIISK